jgi:hypothetical protein
MPSIHALSSPNSLRGADVQMSVARALPAGGRRARWTRRPCYKRCRNASRTSLPVELSRANPREESGPLTTGVFQSGTVRVLGMPDERIYTIECNFHAVGICRTRESALPEGRHMLAEVMHGVLLSCPGPPIVVRQKKGSSAALYRRLGCYLVRFLYPSLGHARSRA